MITKKINVLLVFLFLIYHTSFYSQNLQEKKNQATSRFESIKGNIGSCFTSLPFVHNKDSNLKLDMVNYLKSIVNKEIDMSRLLVSNFENCLTESSLKLDSLKSYLKNYANSDSLQALFLAEGKNYLLQIDSLDSSLNGYAQTVTGYNKTINEVQKDFDKEFSTMTKKLMLEISKAEKQLQKMQNKVSSDLKKKLKVTLPKIK